MPNFQKETKKEDKEDCEEAGGGGEGRRKNGRRVKRRRRRRRGLERGLYDKEHLLFFQRFPLVLSIHTSWLTLLCNYKASGSTKIFCRLLKATDMFIKQTHPFIHELKLSKSLKIKRDP